MKALIMRRLHRIFRKVYSRGSVECREAYYNTYGENCDGDCYGCPFEGY